MKTKVLQNILYTCCQCFYWLACCFVSGYTQIFLESKGYSSSQVGLVLCLGALIGMILQPISAKLSETFPWLTVRVSTLFLDVLAMILALPLFSSTGSLAVLAAFTAIVAITRTIEPFLTSLAFCSGDGSISFSTARGIGSLTFALGALILARVFAHSANGLVSFYILMCGLLCLTVFLLPDRKYGSPLQRERDHSSFIKDNKPFLWVAVGFGFIFIHHMVINNFMWSIVQLISPGNNNLLGISVSLGAAVEVPMMLCFSKVSKRFSTGGLLKFSAAMFLVKPLLILVYPCVATLLISQILQILTYAIFVPASAQYVRETVPDCHMVMGQSSFTTAFAFSNMLSTLLGGIMIERFGILLVVGFTLLFDVLGIVLVFRFAVSAPKEA